MRRNEFCRVTGATPRTFDSHRLAGNLPFRLSERDATEPKWASYDIHQCALWIACANLAGQGIGWSQAAAILREPSTLCSDGERPYERPDIHLARVAFVTAYNEPHRVEIFQGTLGAIVAAATAHVDGFNSRGRDQVQIAGIVSADLSLAYRIARGRAEALGITTGADE